MKNHLLIFCNLGLGDMIITNPIIRHYATQNDLVCVPVKYHNVASVTYMLRDLLNVVIRPVEDHDEAMMFAERVWKGEKLLLGPHGGHFESNKFDQEFYRQAGLPFSHRWDLWNCVRDEQAESNIWNEGYIEGKIEDWEADGLDWGFVHQDHTRGFSIDPKFVPCWPRAIEPNWPQATSENLFAWWAVIEMAHEVHCINSSFALFIDSIALPKNPKLYLHLYARPDGEVPTFRKDWIKPT